MTSAEAVNNDTTDKLQRMEGYLAVDPRNRDLLAGVIDLNLQVGQADRAGIHVNQALTFYPDDPFFRHRQATVLIAQNVFDAAETVLSALLQEVSNPHILYNLAYVHFRQQRFQQARDDLATLMDATDVTGLVVTLYLRTLHHLKDVKHALEVVASHRDRLTADVEFLAVASLLYLDDGQIDMARQFSIAAQAGGAHPLEALVVSGNVALAEGDANAARDQFNLAISINPTDGRSWSGLGLSSLLKHDLENATKELERAVAYMPTHIGTLHVLGWCRILAHDLSMAAAIFDTALALDRNFGETHGGMAVIAALQGNRPLAEERIKRALGLDHHSMSARYAQMVLSGEASDPVKFRAAALKILSTRDGPLGGTLAAVLAGR